MWQNKREMDRNLYKGIVSTILEYYLNDIKDILDDDSDRIYEIISEEVDSYLWINWSRFEYVLDFYTDEEIQGIVEFLGLDDETDDSDRLYNILYYIFDNVLSDRVEDIRNLLKEDI